MFERGLCNHSRDIEEFSIESKSIKTIYLYPSDRPHHALSENSMFERGLCNHSRDIEE